MRGLRLAKPALPILVAAIPVLLMASATMAAGPTGTGPNDPLMVPTGAQNIAPNTTLWFYFDYAVDGSTAGGPGFGRRGGLPGAGASRSSTRTPANIALDASGVGGLAFAVYTPEQAQNWLSDSATAPVGQGTVLRDTSSDEVVHDLYWSGGFNSSGRYLIAVTNGNSVPVSFGLTVTGDSVTLYPPATPPPTPTLPVPFTPVPIPTGTLQGKILFETATGGEIYTVNGDGSALARVSHGIDPTWSPDGSQIVFTRWDNTNPGVFIANADGSNERLVFGAPRTRWPRMSPDGKYIVFSQDKSRSDNNIIWKLGVVDVATGKLLEPRCSQLCFVPSWGQDSATIVYTDPNIGIMTTNAFEGSESVLMGPSGSYWDSGAGFARPNLHMAQIQNSELRPDGSTVVYAQQAHDRWEVNTVHADGSGQTGVTGPDPVLYYLMDVVVHNVTPTWSADGKRILFLSDRNGRWEFFVVNPDGTGVTQVLKNVTDQVPIQFGFENERIMDWTP